MRYFHSFAQRFRRIRLSPLLCLVQNRSWDDVLRRVRRYPLEVLTQEESTGNTPLHYACRLNPPVEIIWALQASSRIKNREGLTPLHVAVCHRCSVDSLKALLECASRQNSPSSSPTADITRIGRAPIHYACMSFRGLELEAFQALFEATLTEGYFLVNAEEDEDDFLGEEFGLSPAEIMSPPAKDDLIESSLPMQQVKVNVIGMKDSTGHTPLSLLFRRYRERVKMVINTVDRLHREHQETPHQAATAAAVTIQADLGELWEKARYIVARLTEERLKREGLWGQHDHFDGRDVSPGEAAVAHEAAAWASEQFNRLASSSLPPTLPEAGSVVTMENNGLALGGHPFRIVHASVGLTGYGCPPEMIRLALSIHPEQVREMDEEGNLPLHIAVAACSYLASVDHNSCHGGSNANLLDMSDDHSVLSDAISFFSSSTVAQTPNPFDKVIKILLSLYPGAAMIPHGLTGQLPLVMAVESGQRTWSDGIRTVLNAYPPALHNKKLIFNYKLYPRVLSQVTRDHNGGVGSWPDHLPFILRGRKICRHEVGARTTLFELLRTKPEWIMKGHVHHL